MTEQRAHQILATYGADPLNWPEAERNPLSLWLAAHPTQHQQLQAAAALDDQLARLQSPVTPPGSALEARILAQHAQLTAAVPSRTPGFRDLLAILGGPRLIAPVLASAFAVGIALGQWLPEAADAPTPAASSAWTPDLFSLAGLLTESPE